MKTIFAGSPHFAAYMLRALLDNGVEVVAVLTQPDKPKGRGLKIKANEVKILALNEGLPVLQPSSLNSDILFEQLRSYQPEVMVVAAYGLLIPTALLKLPKQGCINIHTSLLPRWRGAAPIQRAIEAGDAITGVSVMRMNEGLDTGEILMQQSLAIHPQETAASLQERLQVLGAELMIRTLGELPVIKATVQDEAEACYAYKISKQETVIDWQLPAVQLERKIRAFNPVPVMRCIWRGRLLKIWQAIAVSNEEKASPGQIISVSQEGILVASGEDALLIKELQLAGGKPQSAAMFIQGHQEMIHSHFD